VVISWSVVLTGAQAVEAQALSGTARAIRQQSRRGVEESDRIDKMFDDMTGDDRVKGVQLVMQKRFERLPLPDPVHILDVRKIDVGLGTIFGGVRRYRCDQRSSSAIRLASRQQDNNWHRAQGFSTLRVRAHLAEFRFYPLVRLMP
jgi:uncharacterized ParB-like nuclease family protein